MAENENSNEENEGPAEAISELGPDEQIAALVALARLDMEAAAAYDVAASVTSDETARAALTGFRDDHLRHVEDLKHVIEKRDGTSLDDQSPPESLLAALATTAAAVGDDVAVLALVGNEQLTNRTYEIMLDLEWDDDVRAVLERNAEDERRHLAWLSEVEDQIWETSDELRVGSEAAPP